MKLPYPALFLFSTLLLSPLRNPACGQTISSSPISISTDFESGKLGSIKQVSETHWECALAGESDADNRNRQASWYYFRIDGAKGKNLTINLTDLVGEYNYKAGSHPVTDETRPVISPNQTDWQHLSDQQTEWNEADKTLRLTFTPDRDTVWVAHLPPYTTEPLAQLLTKYQGYPSVVLRTIGYTPQQRPLQLLTVTNTDVPLGQKKVVWLMARQHSWEAGTSYVMDAAICYLLDSAQGQALLDSIVFQVMPMGDPDGVARGGVRFNAFGHDLNRNWDHVVAEEMPEIAAQKKAITTWLSDGHPIDLFLTLHNTESADYLQGPDKPVGQRLWQGMVETSSFESDEGLREMLTSTTPGKPGRMTVNQALWAEEQVPAYLMELKVERVGKLNGRRSVQDWRALGPNLMQSIAAALE